MYRRTKSYPAGGVMKPKGKATGGAVGRAMKPKGMATGGAAMKPKGKATGGAMKTKGYKIGGKVGKS